MADGFNSRILILAARDGRVLQTVQLDLYCVLDIGWRDTQPHLMLFCWPREGEEFHIGLLNVDAKGSHVSAEPIVFPRTKPGSKSRWRDTVCYQLGGC